MYIMSTGDCGVQKRISDPLEFQAFMSCLMGVLGTKLCMNSTRS